MKFSSSRTPAAGELLPCHRRHRGRATPRRGHEVVFHDLYQEGFDPILPDAEIPKGAPLDTVVEQHCREVAEADGYVIVHPNWWGQPPAVLKGWLDRVFRQGVAYEFSPQGVVGLLAGKSAVVVTTSNTPREDELRLFGDPLENLWRACIFGFCGSWISSAAISSRSSSARPNRRSEWLGELRR